VPKLENYYAIFDRDVADSLLAMTWRQFLHKRPRALRRIKELIDFAVEPQPDDSEIRSILANRTIRWTMHHSSPQYHFLGEVLDLVSSKSGCCVFTVTEGGFEHGVLPAVAVDAYLQKDIDRLTLHAVYRLSGIGSPSEWLEISAKDEVEACRDWNPDEIIRPIWPWQGREAHLDTEGDTGLGVVATRRWASFVLRAWQGNRQVPRLSRETLARLPRGKRNMPRFRDFRFADELADAVRVCQGRRSSVFRRWE
jgi:hypothetical protein